MEREGGLRGMQGLTALVLLSLTFVTSLRIDGDLNRIPTPLLFILLLPNLLRLTLRLSTLIAYFSFVVLVILHLVILDAVGQLPFSLSDVASDSASYLGIVGLYLIFFADLRWQSLERSALLLVRAMAVLAIALWLLSVLAGSTYGVDVSYQIPRMHGLMTEPSNLAHYLPALVIFSWRERLWSWLLVGTAGVLLTFSPTVYLTLLLTYMALRAIEARAVYVMMLAGFVAAAVAMVIANFDSLVELLGESGQTGQSVARILEGFSFIASAGQVGANSRADLIFSGVEFMEGHGLWWTGAGFGTSAFIGDRFNGGLLFDSNSWFSLVIWFGLLAIPLFVAIQYLAVRRPLNGFLYVLLVSLCISNAMNAGGVWVQMFFAAMLCLKIRHDRCSIRAGSEEKGAGVGYLESAESSSVFGSR